MKGIITIELGGEKRTLDFTTNGMFEHIEDATGQDGIEWVQAIRSKKIEKNGAFKITAEMKTFAVFIYAGINSHCDVTGEPPVDFPTVRRWCRAIPSEKLGEILTSFYQTYEVKEDLPEGEQKAPALN